MTNMALDPATNDLILVEGGGIVRVSEGRYTVQIVKNKLLTLLGEYALDPTLGWINFDDFVKNPDLFDLEVRAKQVILSCKGVKSVDTMQLTLSQRKLTVQFTATTVYGGIDLAIPWSLI